MGCPKTPRRCGELRCVESGAFVAEISGPKPGGFGKGHVYFRQPAPSLSTESPGPAGARSAGPRFGPPLSPLLENADRPVRIVLPEKLDFECFCIHIFLQILLSNLMVHVQHSFIKTLVSGIQVPLLLGFVEPQ